MAAPEGNQNARKRNRMLSDALKRELTQRPEDVLAIALKLIEDAKAGDSAARSLLFERVDGKVPQPLVGDDEHDAISLKEILIRSVTANDRPASEGG
jgi:hypothetical protein